jgi:hypothetical protein
MSTDMLHGNKTVFIVTSTLPFGFMATKVEALGIGNIIVMNENLEF